MATGSATAGALAAPGPKPTGTTVLPPGLVRTTDGAAPAPVTAMSSNGAPPAVATSATRVRPARPATEATDTGLTTNGDRSQLPVPTDASGVPPHGYDSPACSPKSEPQAATPSDETTACTEIAE